jgi:hypothetical protein
MDVVIDEACVDCLWIDQGFGVQISICNDAVELRLRSVGNESGK